MKTKTLLKSTGLTILIMLLTTLLTNAQIYVQGVAADHEGFAVWDADGSGPEPEGYGHTYLSGANVGYYGSSRDYAGIDPDPGAAMCHFLDNISGFPLFVQALADNGFTPGQVQVKSSLFSMKDDIEGEDWFQIGDLDYYNRYDGYYCIELNGDSMISGYVYYSHSIVFNDMDFSFRSFNLGLFLQLREVFHSNHPPDPALSPQEVFGPTG